MMNYERRVRDSRATLQMHMTHSIVNSHCSINLVNKDTPLQEMLSITLFCVFNMFDVAHDFTLTTHTHDQGVFSQICFYFCLSKLEPLLTHHIEQTPIMTFQQDRDSMF